MSVQLCIDYSALRRSGKGSVFAPVWFETGAGSFPGPHWSDLAPAFVRAWLDALLAIATEATSCEEVSFMDGPYSVELSTIERNRLELKFVRNESDRNVVVFTTEADLRTLLRDAATTGDQILQSYRKMEWADRDEAAIRDNVSQAATVLANV